METKRKTILLVVSILAIVILGAFFALWNPQPPPVVQMPVPNGYTAFVQAGTMVQKQTGEFAKMDAASLSSLVEANSNALQIARSGLAEKSRVPVEYSQSYISAHLRDLSQMKLLAYAFLAEGRLAELEQRTNDAARAYFDTVRLGIDSSRGGPLIDSLVGFAEESMGTANLRKLAPNLDAKTSAELARELEAADAEKESWDQIVQDEKNWTRGAHPGLQYRIAELIGSAEMRAAKSKAAKIYNARQNEMRRLMLDLAAHAYQLDKGHPPANVADLIPAYLKAAPIDPLTGKEMKLTP